MPLPEVSTSVGKPAPAKMDVRVESEMPPFYRMQNQNIFDVSRIETMFPDTNFYWVYLSKTGRNQTQKTWKGWTPVTDKAMIAKMGYDTMLNASGRIQYNDTELWMRPRWIGEKAQDMYNTRLAAKSSTVRASLDAMAADTAGRTGGAVRPFMSSGTPDQDVFTRTPVASLTEAPKSGKEK